MKEHPGISKIDAIAADLSKNLPKPHTGLKLIVTIPAKNEEHNLLNTLKALRSQLNFRKEPFSRNKFEILVLCHNCTDGTYQKCMDYVASKCDVSLHILPFNSEAFNTVGAARRVLMNIASSRIPSDGFIITTDADTIPDKYWLASIDRFKNKDYGLICGLITSSNNGLSEQALHYLNAKNDYLMLRTKLECFLVPDPDNPWPRHSYNWGPNLAIKNSVYKSIGGIQPLHFLEDVDMCNRVVGAGHKIRHSMDAIVNTSTRTDSRCLEGFGAELKIWSEWDGVAYNVEGLVKLLAAYHIYNLLKAYYKYPNPLLIEELCRAAFIDLDSLQMLLNRNLILQAAWIEMKHFLESNETWNYHHPNLSVFRALIEIENYLDKVKFPPSADSFSIAKVHNNHDEKHRSIQTADLCRTIL